MPRMHLALGWPKVGPAVPSEPPDLSLPVLDTTLLWRFLLLKSHSSGVNGVMQFFLKYLRWGKDGEGIQPHGCLPTQFRAARFAQCLSRRT